MFNLSDKLFLLEVYNESLLHCLHGLNLLDAGRVDANDVRERGADKVNETTRENGDEDMLWRERGRGRERVRKRERDGRGGRRERESELKALCPYIRRNYFLMSSLVQKFN